MLNVMDLNCRSQREIKALYSRLAFCQLSRARWELFANEKWTAYYTDEIYRIRRKLAETRAIEKSKERGEGLSDIKAEIMEWVRLSQGVNVVKAA